MRIRRVFGIIVLMLTMVMLTGCDYERNDNCPSDGYCDAITYCGQTGCAGYWGGTCNCD
jgi:hypothetical protein